MAFNKVSREFNHEVKADPDHSQLMIKIGEHSRTFQEAKAIIEDLGANIIETEQLNSNWIVVKLDVADMRHIALRLSEQGFRKIKGFNAAGSKP
jgi:superfamily I DNA and RNA helicase